MGPHIHITFWVSVSPKVCLPQPLGGGRETKGGGELRSLATAKEGCLPPHTPCPSLMSPEHHQHPAPVALGVEQWPPLGTRGAHQQPFPLSWGHTMCNTNALRVPSLVEITRGDFGTTAVSSTSVQHQCPEGPITFILKEHPSGSSPEACLSLLHEAPSIRSLSFWTLPYRHQLWWLAHNRAQ
jgi:hypothetical protein